MDFSIIIVNYNSKELLYNCVNSIVKNISNIDYEVIVVDNFSSDNSFELCRNISDNRLKLIKANDNLGFARANNLGVKESSGKFLHFLNPDTEVDNKLLNDYLRIVNDYYNHNKFVYVNPMRDLDGTVYYGKNYIPDTINYLKYLLCRSKAKWYYIGATVAMSREVFEQIGGWNEKIFMYEEDSDLFYKINKHNIPIVELPAVIFHYGGGSSKNAFTDMGREILIQKSLRIYFKSNGLSILNYICFEIMMVLSFLRKPKRALWQIKAIVKSFLM